MDRPTDVHPLANALSLSLIPFSLRRMYADGQNSSLMAMVTNTSVPLSLVLSLCAWIKANLIARRFPVVKSFRLIRVDYRMSVDVTASVSSASGDHASLSTGCRSA